MGKPASSKWVFMGKVPVDSGMLVVLDPGKVSERPIDYETICKTLGPSEPSEAAEYVVLKNDIGSAAESRVIWSLSYRADPRALPIADRHYNRQAVGSSQFVPPGRCVVLLTPDAGALWVTSWPFGQYVKHRWPGAWICSVFRREHGGGRASDMIRQAVAVTRSCFGEPPERGMVTFIDRTQVKPTMVRGVATWGWTWLKAGFEPDGETKAGLLAFRMPPAAMPAAEAPLGSSGELFAVR